MLRSMALQDIAVSFQLIFVIGHDLVGRIVRKVLKRYDFYSETESGDVHVGALVVAAGVFGFGGGAGIETESDIGKISTLADMDSAKQCLDIDLLVFSVAFLLDVDAAGAQGQD